MDINQENLDLWKYWVLERNQIQVNKDELKLPKDQLTDDETMSTYRFCNVFRELDSTTIWMKENVRDKYLGNPHYIAIIAMMRIVNEPAAIEEILEGNVTDQGVDWDAVDDAAYARFQRGDKIERGAYMICTVGAREYRCKFSKYVADTFKPMARDNDKIIANLQEADSIEECIDAISTGYHAIGKGFMAGQILIDLAHTPVLDNGWYKTEGTVVGPGSKKGLTIIFGDARDWEKKMDLLRATLPFPISMHDVQNTLCEFSKYYGIKNGIGARRRKF